MRNFSTQIALTLGNWRIFVMVGLGCVFFALARPFDSSAGMSFGDRLSFWIPLFVFAFATIAVSHGIVVHGMRVQNLVAARIASYLVFSGIFTPLIYGFLLFGNVKLGIDDVSFSVLASWVLMTAGICTWVFALMNPERVLAIVNEDIAEDKSAPPRLLLRLCRSDDDTVEITRLTVNDHYVVVGLTDGTEQRLLMRLADAIAEMDDVQGYTTHRSHWVSRSHVVGVVFEGKREMLELSSGVRVPISRTYRPVLVAAGVIPVAKQQYDGQLTP